LELNAVRQWPSRTESGHPLQPADVPVSLITLPVQPNKTKQKKLLFLENTASHQKATGVYLLTLMRKITMTIEFNINIKLTIYKYKNSLQNMYVFT